MGVSPYSVLVPLFALFGVAVVAPLWFNWIVPTSSQYAAHIEFLVTLVPVVLMVLLIASWLEPGVS